MHDPHVDPAAMRARAAAIRLNAESLRALGERLDRRVDGLVYEGPAAVRFRAAAVERSHRTRGAVRELDRMADRLQHEATRAEQQLADGRPHGGV
jgi:uncharacterized protein YukE